LTDGETRRSGTQYRSDFKYVFAIFTLNLLNVQGGHNKVMELLLVSGGQVLKSTSETARLLLLAAESNSAELWGLLLPLPDLDWAACDWDGRTPLHAAVQSRASISVDALLSVDTGLQLRQARDRWRLTPADWALRLGDKVRLRALDVLTCMFDGLMFELDIHTATQMFSFTSAILANPHPLRRTPRLRLLDFSITITHYLAKMNIFHTFFWSRRWLYGCIHQAHPLLLP
jgi:hypothetical protein